MAEVNEECKSHSKLYKHGYIDGQGLTDAIVNQMTKIELQLFDTYPSLTIDATVTHCHSQSIVASKLVNSDNKHQITYTPTNRGKHEINLTINGTHIRGSPFTVVVMPQPHTLGVPTKMISDLKSPFGVAVNKKGHVIVTEYGSGQILTYNEKYEQIQIFDSRGQMSGVTVDGDDNIYAGDCKRCTIQKFTANGQFLLAVGTKGDQKLQFNRPIGLGYNETNDKIYVCDDFNNRIQVLNTDLTFHSIMSTNELKEPADISFDSVGNAYIANLFAHNVIVFDSSGKLLRMIGREGTDPGQLYYPIRVTVSNNDTVFVAEALGYYISIFKTSGEFICCFGKEGVGEGQLREPAGLAIDSNGYIVVTDDAHGRIQVF